LTPSATPPAPTFDPANPGHWKLSVLLQGICVPEELAREFEAATGVAVTARLLLEFPKNLLCLAQVHVGNCAAGPGGIELAATAEGWELRRGKESISIQIRPPLVAGLAGRAARIGDSVVVDLSREAWGARLRAHYGFSASHLESAPQTIEPVLDAIEEVARKRTLGGIHVLAYDDPALPDARSALARLAPLFEAIHRNFATALAVETWPPEGVAVLEAAYAAGMDILCLHLGAFQARQAAQLVEGRSGLSNERYELAFAAAGEILESGALKSAVFVGEDAAPEAFQRGLRKLLKDGAVPLLWPVASALPGAWARAAAVLREAALLFEKSGVGLSRVQESSLQLPPAELRYFHPEQKALVGGLASAAGTGLGRAAQRNLSALRRHLRVRGSGDASGHGE